MGLKFINSKIPKLNSNLNPIGPNVHLYLELIFKKIKN